MCFVLYFHSNLYGLYVHSSHKLQHYACFPTIIEYYNFRSQTCFTSIEINQLTGICTEHVTVLWIWSLLLSVMIENQKENE